MEGIREHICGLSRLFPLLGRFASWQVLVQRKVAFMAQYGVFSWGADLEALGCFVPVWPRSPCVEDVKVFLRTAKHPFYTRPT